MKGKELNIFEIVYKEGLFALLLTRYILLIRLLRMSNGYVIILA
jgi:hypothetical protein